MDGRGVGQNGCCSRATGGHGGDDGGSSDDGNDGDGRDDRGDQHRRNVRRDADNGGNNRRDNSRDREGSEDRQDQGAPPGNGSGGSGSGNRDGSWPSRQPSNGDDDSSAFRPPNGSDTALIRLAVTIGVAATAPVATDAAAVAQRSYGGVKLDLYDRTTSLETFLAAVKNFATFYEWTEREELFYLRASLRGPAAQMLWDLPTDTTLQGLVVMLKQRFGSIDQAERFRAELKARRRGVGEDLQSLYNDVRRLMSLAYPGPNMELMDVVGRDEFLNALGDPDMRIHILDKIEALEKSRDTQRRVVEPPEEYWDDEPCKKKGNPSRLLARAVDVANDEQKPESKSEPKASALVDVTQLKEALTSCVKEVMQEAEAKKQVAVGKPLPSFNTTVYRQSQPGYRPPAMGRGGYGTLRPRATYGQVTGGYRAVGPRSSGPAPGSAGVCFNCRRGGHLARNCWRSPAAPAQDARTATSKPPSGEGSGKVQQAMNFKELREVYVPVKLFDRKMTALLDTGCDSTLIGLWLLPPGTRVEPTSHELFAANGSAIPVEGTTKLTFQVGNQDFTIQAVVTKAVHELILGVDFLIDADVEWRFRYGRIKLGNEWISLRHREVTDDVCKVYACSEYIVSVGAQVEVPVEISRPTLGVESEFWATDPLEIDDGVVAGDGELFPQS